MPHSFRRLTVALLSAAAVVIAVSACVTPEAPRASEPRPTTTSTPPPPTPTPAQTPEVVAVATTTSNTKWLSGMSPTPVISFDGCLALGGDDPSREPMGLLISTAHFTVHGDGSVQGLPGGVIGGKSFRLKVGDTVRLIGGAISREELEASDATFDIPDACQHVTTYWLV